MNYKGTTTEFVYVCVCVCVCDTGHYQSSQHLFESRSRLELLEKRNARRDLPDRACSSVCPHSDCFWMQKNSSSMMGAEVFRSVSEGRCVVCIVMKTFERKT